jgi:dTDP-4-amino-4,6-dideoxygalactose transaminase
VFADVQPHDGCLDPGSVARAVTKKTRAILVTHLFGHPADMDALRMIAGKRIVLIEDAAQAHGGTWKGKPLGSLGDFGCFSFYPTKNLGGLGDGGAIFAKTKKQAERLRRLRDHGQVRRFFPEEAGFNARMDAIQAQFLTLKLPRLREDNARRAEVAARYLDKLDGHGMPEPLLPDGRGLSAWHAFIVKSPQRAALIRKLREPGIGHQIYYPATLPDLPAYRKFSHHDCPVARELARTALALPLHPALRKADTTAVLRALTR